MLYREYQRIQNLKEWLSKVAYASLAIDFAIALATLAEIHFSGTTSIAGQILLYLNYALTAEVVLTALLFVALVFFMHYQRVLDTFYQTHRAVRYRVRRSMEHPVIRHPVRLMKRVFVSG